MIQVQLEDSSLMKATSDEYYYESARAYSIKGEMDKAYEFIKQDYKMNPENLNIIGLFQQLFLAKIQTKINDIDFSDFLNNSLTEYSCLTKSPDVLRIGSTYYLQKAFFYFEHTDAVKGRKYLDSFERFNDKFNAKVENVFAGEVYSAASSCYYRIKDSKNCKAILEKGLKLYPNNEALIRKYKVNVTHDIK